jgi:diguanylate cyclase (GGDEF)-like protein
MALSLSIRHRLLLSHLFAVVVLAGAFGAFIYYTAAQQVVERINVQLKLSAAALAQTLDGVGLDQAMRDDSARIALSERLRKGVEGNADIALTYVTFRSVDGEHVFASSNDNVARAALAADPHDGRLTARAPVPGAASYAIQVETGAGRVGEQLYTLRLSAALAFLVCVLAASILSRHLAGRFQISITDLIARCHALANGDPLPPRRPGARDEFDKLTREFDAMAGRLRHTAEGRERAHIALRDANERLESRVRERTSDLEGATLQLRAEIESRVHVEALLAEAALTDPLTGLLNRRAMMEMLGQASAELKPGEPGLSVIVADIDHFKLFNDRNGHAFGDQVLAAVAGRLREFSGDQIAQHVARWGGEEFLILLPRMRLAPACKRAEQVRRNVADLRIGKEQLQVSLSLGVAELVAGEALDSCLRRCDQALYRAKEAGRDTVVAAQGGLFATMS